MIRAGACPPIRELDLFVRNRLQADESADLERHTAACESCRELLAELRADAILVPSLRAVAGADGPTPDEEVSEGLAQSGYSVVRELHRGGQGVVYVAEQLSTHRNVAVKVLHGGVNASDRQRMRFEREVELAAGLSHPNIVTVFDRGELDDGRRFYAMELIDGVPFDVHAREHGLSVRARVELFVKLCDAVRLAHQRGVIHRDLKPENILVDEQGEPQVLDFGLAKPSDADPAAAATVSGEFVGTLAFASPEQVSGQPDAVDARTDVYSLGVVLYRTLTGVPPYPIDGSLLRIVRNVTDLVPDAPSRHARGIDTDLDVICARALAKDPERRYQSVDALSADLGSWLAGHPIAARSDSGWYVLTKALRRHRLLVAATLVVLVSLVTAVAISQASLRRARVQSTRAETANEFLIDTLTAVEPGNEPIDTRVVDLMRRAAAAAGRSYATDPAAEAAIRDALGSVFHRLGLFAESRQQQRRLITLLDEELSDDDLWRFLARVDLVLLLTDEQRLDEAELLLTEARALEQDGFPRTARALLARRAAGLRIAQARYGEAEALLAEARSHLTEEDAQQRLELLSEEGLIAKEQEDWVRATNCFEQHLAGLRATLGDEHPRTLIAAQSLAQVLALQGNTSEVKERSEALLAQLETDLGADATLYNIVRLNLTWSLMKEGDHEGALDNARAIHATWQRLHGDDHSRTVLALHNLAAVLEAAGKLTEAEPLMRTVLAKRRAALGEDAYHTALTELNLAMTAGRTGKAPEAAELLRHAAEVFARTLGADARKTLLTRNVLGVLLHDTGAHEECVEVFQDLLERTSGPDVVDRYDRGAWLFSYADSLASLGRVEEARGACLQALDRLAADRGTDHPLTEQAEALLVRLEGDL